MGLSADQFQLPTFSVTKKFAATDINPWQS
jgi:hypothetical protein